MEKDMTKYQFLTKWVTFKPRMLRNIATWGHFCLPVASEFIRAKFNVGAASRVCAGVEVRGSYCVIKVYYSVSGQQQIRYQIKQLIIKKSDVSIIPQYWNTFY